MHIENKNAPQDAEFSTSYSKPAPQQASRFKRWLASLINSVLLWPGVMIAAGASEVGSGEIALFGLLISFAVVIIQVYFMKTHGQTLGKRWLGLRVYNANSKQPISFGSYIGREIVDMLLGWTSVLILVSGVVALIREDRRSLTDLLVGSVVMTDIR